MLVLLLIANFSYANESSLILRGGVSHLLGFTGLEYKTGMFGISAGWGGKWGADDGNDAYGASVILYGSKAKESTLYGAIGVMINGYYMSPSHSEYEEPLYDNLYSGIIGYRFVFDESNFDIRTGVGYLYNEYTSDVAFDLVAGYSF